MLVVFFGAEALIALVTTAVAGDSVWAAIWSLVLGVVFAGLALGLYVLAVRTLERRPADEVTGSRAGLGRGVVLGMLLFTVVITVVAVFGGYRITGWGSVAGALSVLGVTVAVAVAEELLFRGVLFRIVEELAGTIGALVVSAGLFGLLHLLNPEATVFGAFAIAVEGGLMAGAAYAATRTLWLPIGLHLGWNFAEGGLFGTTVSGTAGGSSGLFDSVLSGPVALTGGDFGPEASIVSILVCAVPTVLFLRAARRNGNLRARR
jgi:membrane protease YdiL (CAAX protease family)